MTLTTDTLTLLLVLMPGFLASILLDMLVVRKSKEGITLIVEALIFSGLIYVCIGLLFKEPPFTVQAPGGTGGFPHVRISNVSALGVMMALSLLLPTATAASLTHGGLMRFLEKIKVTRRTGRATMWLDVFIDHRRYVVVQLANGDRVYGWPEYYSDDVTEGMLYLNDPYWINNAGEYTRLAVQGLLIPNRTSIESIAFTHRTRDDADPDKYVKITASHDPSLSVKAS